MMFWHGNHIYHALFKMKIPSFKLQMKGRDTNIHYMLETKSRDLTRASQSLENTMLEF